MTASPLENLTQASEHDGPPLIAIDRLDRQLLHALQIDGRAPFRRLASVLGASEQTVARRYRRLRDAGVVRVLALPDPERTGQVWMLRIQVEPAAARPLAMALAARPDVSWIGLIAGGAEIACGVRTGSRGERDALLLDRLPRVGRVIGITASATLHRFVARTRGEWDGFEDPLTYEQRRRLADARPSRGHRTDATTPSDAMATDAATPSDATAPTGAPLTAEDEPLLALLAEDGRMSYAEMAARTGRSEAQVSRRVDGLFSGGEIFVDIDIAAELLGFSTAAMLYLTVAPSELQAVGEELAGHPESAFVAATTGPANLTASLLCTGTEHLYRYLTTRIGAIPAIHAVETVPVLERVKQARSLMRGPLLAPH